MPYIKAPHWSKWHIEHYHRPIEHDSEIIIVFTKCGFLTGENSVLRADRVPQDMVCKICSGDLGRRGRKKRNKSVEIAE